MTSTDRTDQSAPDVLPVLEEIYAKVKRIHRELRPADRIVADLEVDSLATLEILLALEERFGVSLVDNPRAARVETVADLVALLDDLRHPAP
ncbi:acyl carrier protein [Amycolatopsis arida]|uniref:Acyl carrier protein n=1 Tax=Amycolatopsis arida TaxID=587909 RepID=A0A1I5V720_9PSEU|nr:acyl carrier protein [Amycolatopsis arida]TDX91171.1 acyl carrier protein [Amycolatopsis arida]SFQ03147.1 acyl carrier protein [Amycolatopsis arida]